MIFIIFFSLGARAEKMGFPSINDLPSEYVVLKYGKTHFSLLIEFILSNFTNIFSIYCSKIHSRFY